MFPYLIPTISSLLLVLQLQQPMFLFIKFKHPFVARFCFVNIFHLWTSSRFVFLFVMHPLLLQNVVHSPPILFSSSSFTLSSSFSSSPSPTALEVTIAPDELLAAVPFLLHLQHCATPNFTQLLQLQNCATPNSTLINFSSGIFNSVLHLAKPNSTLLQCQYCATPQAIEKMCTGAVQMLQSNCVMHRQEQLLHCASVHHWSGGRRIAVQLLPNPDNWRWMRTGNWYFIQTSSNTLLRRLVDAIRTQKMLST